MHCAIWYHFYNLKNVKNTHEGVLILVKLQAEACNFTKIGGDYTIPVDRDGILSRFAGILAVI